MEKDTLNNVHICSEQVLMTPAELKEQLPISNQALNYIEGAREAAWTSCPSSPWVRGLHIKSAGLLVVDVDVVVIIDSF